MISVFSPKTVIAMLLHFCSSLWIKERPIAWCSCRSDLICKASLVQLWLGMTHKAVWWWALSRARSTWLEFWVLLYTGTKVLETAESSSLKLQSTHEMQSNWAPRNPSLGRKCFCFFNQHMKCKQWYTNFNQICCKTDAKFAILIKWVGTRNNLLPMGGNRVLETLLLDACAAAVLNWHHTRTP